MSTEKELRQGYAKWDASGDGFPRGGPYGGCNPPVSNSTLVLPSNNTPMRATTLPEDAAERKQYPVASGVMDYFPDAIVAIANLSFKGNEQHNPGQPLHWSRGKSDDHADTMMRHFLQRGTIDKDGVPHSVKMAWRALAILQLEMEK